MAREGLESLYPLDATAVMGLREVVPAIPRILRRVSQAVDFAVATQPDAVVVIDSPDFTHRVARGIKQRDRLDPHRGLCGAAGLGQPRLSRQGDGDAISIWCWRCFRSRCRSSRNTA